MQRIPARVRKCAREVHRSVAEFMCAVEAVERREKERSV